MNASRWEVFQLDNASARRLSLIEKQNCSIPIQFSVSKEQTFYPSMEMEIIVFTKKTLCNAFFPFKQTTKLMVLKSNTAMLRLAC